MATRGRPVHGKKPRRQERSRLLIVTEGAETEVQYLQGLVQDLRRTGVSVRSCKTRGIGRDPKRVVEAAVAGRSDRTADFDDVWAVVDVDTHATLTEAIQMAVRESVPLVISNPSFEIWLLWHYEDCTSYQSQGELERKLQKLGHEDKNLPSKFPFAAVRNAVMRAQANPLSIRAKGPNPSSALPHLVTALQRI